jgi:hypothetical protein
MIRALIRVSVMTATVVIAPVKAGDAGSLSEASISNRLKLLENFTSSRKTLDRLERSGSREANAHFAATVAASEAASRALEARDLEAASSSIETGYEQMALTLRLAKDQSRQTKLAAERYEALSQQVTGFREAFRRIASEKNDPEISALVDQQQLDELIGKARLLAGENGYQQANEMMQRAATMLERALSVAQDRETLDARVALLERRGGSTGALQVMRGVLLRNREARAEARAMVASGDVAEAISMLEERSEEMSRVLQMLGLAF